MDVLGVLVRRFSDAAVDGGREDAGFKVNVAEDDPECSCVYSEDEYGKENDESWSDAAPPRGWRTEIEDMLETGPAELSGQGQVGSDHIVMPKAPET
ncbi:hypothetical protein FRC17_003802 [Serendipita sp. 399]|nr:hypothetical protein FRC17_003802 [Serendipita sp. 399]